jgi:hypothetical protein
VVDAVLGPLVEMLGRVVEEAVRRWAHRPDDPRPVGMLADRLAKAVSQQWRQEAAERMLLTPAPIPVGWSLSAQAVSGPLEAALGDPEMAPLFPPLPGHSRVTEEQLQAGGGRRELFAVYAGIASGRVVVLGEPGAGKTGSAVLLMLDALEHREGLQDSQRARVPVPVLVTAYGWDPITCPVRDCLVDRLVVSYPRLFAHRGGRDEADALVAAGGVALVLDGLDEMDIARHRAALRALSEAPFRMVVLTRSKEMAEAAGVAWLVGALALQLREVTGTEGAEYLHRASTGPPPRGWTELLTHLRENPDSVVTRGLSTPLALTLIRDTYGPGDDLNGLLTTPWNTAEDLERYLIARVVSAAYTHRPGRPAPRYSQAQAEQVLAFLAQQMNQRNQDNTRDLAWWQIPQWVPASPRILASMLAAGLVGGLVFALAFVPVSLLPTVGPALLHELGLDLRTEPGSMFLDGLAFGFGVGLPLGIGFERGRRKPKRVRNRRAINWRSVLTAGLGYGLVSGPVTLLLLALLTNRPAIPDRLGAHLVGGFAVNFVGGLILGLTFALSGWRSENQDTSQNLVNNRRQDRLFGLVAELVLGLATGIMTVHSLHLGLVSGFAAGLAALLVFRLISRLAGGLVTGLASGSADGKPGPQGPRETWRNDRAFSLRVGLGYGLGVGAGVGVAYGFVPELVPGLRPMLVHGLMNFLAIWFSVALVYGVTSSVTWSTTLAWRQLRRTHHVPTVALMPFLEDARNRGVLRTVGAVYQFRHATLQDKLAEHIIINPLTESPCAPET